MNSLLSVRLSRWRTRTMEIPVQGGGESWIGSRTNADQTPAARLPTPIALRICDSSHVSTTSSIRRRCVKTKCRMRLEGNEVRTD